MLACLCAAVCWCLDLPRVLSTDPVGCWIAVLLSSKAGPADEVVSIRVTGGGVAGEGQGPWVRRPGVEEGSLVGLALAVFSC